MYVGCWDCGVPLSKFKRHYERPRTVKMGWDHTVDVCPKCQKKWFDAFPKTRRE